MISRRRSARQVVAITAAALALGIGSASAQPSHSVSHAHNGAASGASALSPEVVALLESTRKAAEDFHDRRAAILSGYRRIGPDVPSMGEHWISPRLVVADSFDVRHPALLTYIKVEGKPVLTGVVYAVPLTPGQSPPDIFGASAAWHEHNGTLDEEALLPDHHTAPSAATGTRLAILHAWLWSPNPEGMFATDNWTTPFLRLGLTVPASFQQPEARALSLLSGAQEYFRNLAGESNAEIVAASLDKCASAAAEVVHRARAGGAVLSVTDLDELRRLWTAAMTEIGNVAGADVAKRLNGGRSLP